MRLISANKKKDKRMFGFGEKKKFDFEEYLEGSMEGLRLATDAHRNTWHLGSEKTWNVDQNSGILSFCFEDGLVAAAPAQIIGTYDSQQGSFMWGWDHPSVALGMQKSAMKAKAFGQKRGIDELTTHVVSCDHDRAWAYAALAMREASDSGAFRAPANQRTFVFMTFGKVALRKA